MHRLFGLFSAATPRTKGYCFGELDPEKIRSTFLANLFAHVARAHESEASTLQPRKIGVSTAENTVGSQNDRDGEETSLFSLSL